MGDGIGGGRTVLGYGGRPGRGAPAPAFRVVDGAFAAFQVRDVESASDLRWFTDDPLGTRNFVMRDRGGNRIQLFERRIE